MAVARQAARSARSMFTPLRVRAVLDGLTVGFLGLVAWFCIRAIADPSSFIDANAYYRAALDDPYRVSALGALGAYLYSPAFLQVIAPLKVLPAGLFAALVVCGEATALLVLAGRWTGVVAVAGLAVVYPELDVANVNFMLALAIVAGFRWPALWSSVLLTKVTPAVGLLWFVARRDWRSLAVALVATVVVGGVSFVLAPGLWTSWLRVLAANGARPSTLVPRLAAAAALIAWAAPRGNRWAVPVAATLGMPDMYGPAALAMLAGVLPLLARRGSTGLGADKMQQVVAAN